MGPEDGTSLRGQRQRLALARAFLTKLMVLLLYGATSSLESEAERLVQEAIERALVSARGTVVAVAHLLATIQNAGKLARLLSSGDDTNLCGCHLHDRQRQGPVKGTHRELLKKRGLYCQMGQVRSPLCRRRVAELIPILRVKHKRCLDRLILGCISRRLALPNCRKCGSNTAAQRWIPCIYAKFYHVLARKIHVVRSQNEARRQRLTAFESVNISKPIARVKEVKKGLKASLKPPSIPDRAYFHTSNVAP